MADKYLRDGVVLAKEEVTPGVDAVPDATNAILCSVPAYGMEASKRTRDFMRSTLSPMGFSPGMKKQTISFMCELKGPNNAVAPGTATRLDPLFKACGLGAYEILVLPVSSIVGADIGDLVTGAGSATGTVVRTETGKIHLKSVTGTFIAAENATWTGGSGTVGASPMADKRMEYYPVSDRDAHKSATIYYYMDGILHALVYARGTAKAAFSLEGFPSVEFSMTGLYTSPTDTSAPASITLEDHDPPVCLGIGLAIGSYAPTGVESLSLDMGIKIAEKKGMESEQGLSGVYISGREPKLTLDCGVEDLASFNPYTIFENATKSLIKYHAGETIGNRVFVLVPHGQLEEPKVGEKDDRAVYNLTVQCTGSDDEFFIQTG